jgi:hypothetical protein
MKGLITKGMAAMCLASGFTLSGGCHGYRDLVDPCYPERYEYAARQEVIAAIAPQVNNGHVLDQTVWNSHFEAGTDKLTAGGLEHLAYLARRRPCPDPMVYLQTAQDIRYDPAAPEKLAEARTSLDNRRIQAIQNYLNADTAGRHVSFEVLVHDPSEVGIAALPANIAVLQMYSGSRGNLPSGGGAGGANVSGGGGATGGGAAGGGAAGGGGGSGASGGGSR